jgi:hypothetical protein
MSAKENLLSILSQANDFGKVATLYNLIQERGNDQFILDEQFE